MAICPVCNTDTKESRCHVCDMEILEANLVSLNDIDTYKKEIESRKNQRINAFVPSDTDKRILARYNGKESYIKIPEAFNVIGDGCFRDARNFLNIKTVFIPKGVVSINSYSLMESQQPGHNGAFAFCENLETVIFEEGSCLQEIGKMAFYNCIRLKKIEGLEKTVGTVKIDTGAFSRCNKEIIKHLIALDKNYPGKFIFYSDWSK